MNKLPVTMVAAVFLAALPVTAWAVRNPVGSGTAPPSNRRSGLIRSPNPIDTSGNLVITGNLTRGRHFRGVVPYRATSDFAASLGSSSFDSFLRDSAGSEDFGRHIGKPRPYYSSTRTVTTTMPGRHGTIRTPAVRTDGRTVGRLILPALPKKHPLLKQNIATAARPDSLSYHRFITPQSHRPMSLTTQQMAKLFTDQIEKDSQDSKSTDTDSTSKQRRQQLEQFRRDLKAVSDKVTKLRQTLAPQDKSLQPFTKSDQGEQIKQRLEAQPPKQKLPTIELIDVYEQMKLQIDSLQKAPEPPQIKTIKPAKEAPEEEGEKPAERRSQTERLSDVGMSVAKAKSILGEHKTFASFANDKFNQHLRVAEEYLKQGKYYRAADVYTLASIYKPDDPLAYAGKSHALFAAGEYMSSALFLSRALEIFPKYAQFQIDIEEMVGDRDILESRIADAELWVEKSDAPELQFLLGYIYYHLGRIDAAKKAIDAAYEKMPQSPAIISLKKTIDANRK